MKNNILLFIALCSLGIIVTYPAFIPSHALDSYCTMYNGYYDTATWFLQNGRVISALVFAFYGFVNLPFDSMGYLSLLFSNIFLAFSIVILYNYICSKAKVETKIKRLSLLLGLFLIFYTPIYTEILLFDEVGVIALGILFMTLAAVKIADGKIKNYVLALLFAFLGIICYQGIACYLLPLVLIVILMNGDEDRILAVLKKCFIALIIYGVSFVLNLLIIKIVASFVGSEIAKVGSFNIISNFNIIFTSLIPNSFKYLFGFSKTTWYYALLIIILLVAIYFIIKNEDKKYNIIMLVLLILTCLLMPFVPNIFMNSESNYTAARMCLTLMILPGVLIVYLICLFDLKRFIYFIFAFSICLFMFNSFFIHQNIRIDFKRFKEDVRYIKEVNQRIIWYENKSGYKVKKVYYAKDTSVDFYYRFGGPNGANIRLLAVDWALECAFPVYTEKKYSFKKMSNADYKKYFDKVNYDKFNKKQLKFEKDKLYLLLY